MISLQSNAKLNLCLFVGSPFQNGYHPLFSIFQEINLFDTLEITKTSSPTIHITSNNPDIPLDSTNLLSKVYEALKSNLKFGCNIHLEKHIPTGSGLGGGSSNAATFLNWLLEEAGLKLSYEKKCQIAASFGADVPFFIQGKTALVTGIGENIQSINGPKQHFVLINPKIHCNTQTIYQTLDKKKFFSQLPVSLSDALIQKNTLLGPNDLKQVVYTLYPIYHEIEQSLIDLSFGPVYMSGSGATLFVQCNSYKEATKWENQLKSHFPDFFIQAVSSVH